MTAAQNARSAYQNATTAVNTPRQIEYQAFAKVTHQLSAVLGREREAFPELAEALHQNKRLWTTLATDVAVGDNGLPDLLRAQLFYLAEFTRDHSRKVLKGEADASALIEINTSVMKGLRDSLSKAGEGAPCPA